MSHTVRSIPRGARTFVNDESSLDSAALISAHIEREGAHDPKGLLKETLTLLREKSRALEAPLA